MCFTHSFKNIKISQPSGIKQKFRLFAIYHIFWMEAFLCCICIAVFVEPKVSRVLFRSPPLGMHAQYSTLTKPTY